MFGIPNIYSIGITIGIIALLSFGTYHYHSAYVKQVSKTAVLKKEVKDLQGIIALNSIAIDNLAKEAKKREDIAKEALALTQRKLKEALKRSQEIIILPPSDPDNLCKSSETLFNQYLESISTTGK